MVAFKGWKTLAFGLLVAVAPPILALLGSIDWSNSHLPAWAISLIGIVIMLLRWVTTTPIGKAVPAIFFGLVLAGGLSACAPQQVQTTMSNSFAAAEIALTSAEKAALVYTQLPRCPATTALCSDPATVAKIKSADNVAYNAVQAARSNEALISVALVAVQNLSNSIPK